MRFSNALYWSSRSIMPSHVHQFDGARRRRRSASSFGSSAARPAVCRDCTKSEAH